MERELVQSINPMRIQWCLDDRGVDVATCAAETGIGEKTLLKALTGVPALSFNQLNKLAGYFGRGVLFFLESAPVVEAKVHSPAFRTLANQKPELSPKLRVLIQRVERQREVFVSLREDLDEEAAPKFQAPRLNRGDVESAAATVRKWLNLGPKNSFPTYREAIEAKGILVFRSNGYAGKWQIAKENPILGFSLYDAECPVIFVKKTRYESRQSFTLMHELAHVLLDRRSWIDDEDDLYGDSEAEQTANNFAGLVLVPPSFLDEIRDRDRPSDVSGYDAWLEPQRDQWGVSTEVILRRLHNARRLSKENYLAYRRYAKRHESETEDASGGSRYRSREPKHVFGEPFVRLVLDAVNAQRITLNRASTYLDSLKISDLKMLEQHCAGL